MNRKLVVLMTWVIVFIGMFTLAFNIAQAQPPETEWNRTYGVSRILSGNWSHYFTEPYYTTKDWRAVYAVSGPFNDPNNIGWDIDCRYYDPSGEDAFAAPSWANSSIVTTYEYSGGVLTWVKNYFYISGNGEARDPGQYRVDFYERRDIPYPYEFRFSDYFQIYVNETFQVNIDGAIFDVTVLSNSTLSNFNFNKTEKKIALNVTGADGTLGFCNLTLPNSLIQDLWQGDCAVLVEGKQPLTVYDWTDGIYTYIYFTYLHSEHRVEIIPEFPSFLILPIFMIATLLAVILYRRKRSM